MGRCWRKGFQLHATTGFLSSFDVSFSMFTLIIISEVYVNNKGVLFCMDVQDKIQNELSKNDSGEKNQILENFN